MAGASNDIPAEDKVSNSTTEDDREDGKTADCRVKVKVLRNFLGRV